MSFNLDELDKDGIKENFVQYLKDQSVFTDFNYSGSGMAVILDMMAQHIHYSGFYTYMLGAEMFVDSAKLKNNLSAKAKLLGYLPRSSRSAYAVVDISIDTSVNPTPPNFIIIPAGTDISADNNRTFISIDDVVLRPDINTPTTLKAEGIKIYEGELINTDFIVDNQIVQQSYEIVDDNIDTTTMRINVNGLDDYFESDIINLDANSKVFFLTLNSNDNYSFQFGNDVYGKRPSTGDTINLSYVSPTGENGENASVFTMPNGITYDSFFYDVALNTVQNSIGHKEPEKTDELRFNIPNHFKRQNRLVTIDDYRTYISSEYSFLDSVSVWSGKDNVPVTHGTIFISVTPIITESAKAIILEDLLTKASPVVSHQFVDAEIIKLNLSITALQRVNTAINTDTAIKSAITEAIDGYNIGLFGNEYINSDVVELVKDSDDSLVDALIDINMTISSNNTFQRSILAGSVTSSLFTFNGVPETYIVDNGDGVIRLATNTDNESHTATYGTIDYETGEVNPLLFSFVGIDFTAIIRDNHVTSDRSKLISIDDTTIEIKVIK